MSITSLSIAKLIMPMLMRKNEKERARSYIILRDGHTQRTVLLCTNLWTCPTAAL